MDYNTRLLEILNRSPYLDPMDKWRDLREVIDEVSEKEPGSVLQEIVDQILPVLDDKLPIDARVLPWNWECAPMEALCRAKSLIDFNDHINGNKNPMTDPSCRGLSDEEMAERYEEYFGDKYQVGIITAFDITYNGNFCAAVCELDSGNQMVLRLDFKRGQTSTLLETDEIFDRIVISSGGNYIALISETEVKLFNEDEIMFIHNFEERIENDIILDFDPEHIFRFCPDESFFLFFHQKEGTIAVVNLPGGDVRQREFDSIIWSLDIMPLKYLIRDASEDQYVILKMEERFAAGLLDPETLEYFPDLVEKLREEALWLSGPGSYNVIFTRSHPEKPLIGFFEPFEQTLYDNNNQTSLYGGISFYEKKNDRWQSWDHLFHEEILDSRFNTLAVREGGLTAGYMLRSGEVVIVEFPERRVTVLKAKIYSQVWEFGPEPGTIIVPVADSLNIVNYHRPGETLAENRRREALHAARRIIKDELIGVGFDYLADHLDSIEDEVILCEVIDAIGPAVKRSSADDLLPRPHWENNDPRMALCPFRWVDYFSRKYPWQYSHAYIIELKDRWIIIHGIREIIITAVERKTRQQKELHRLAENLEVFSHASSPDQKTTGIMFREEYHDESPGVLLIFQQDILVYREDDISGEIDTTFPGGLLAVSNDCCCYWLANKGLIQKFNITGRAVESRRKHDNLFSMTLQPGTDSLLVHDRTGFFLYDSNLEKRTELICNYESFKTAASDICFTGDGSALVTSVLADCTDSAEKPEFSYQEPKTHRYIITRWKVPENIDFSEPSIAPEPADCYRGNFMEYSKCRPVQCIMRQEKNYVDTFFRDSTALTFNVI